MIKHPVTGALHQAAQVFEDRNAVYSNAYLKVGPIMQALFPAGMKLETPEDHTRYHLLMLIVVKLTRYSASWETGHEDSMSDVMTYAAMLQALDLRARLATDRDASEGFPP